MKEEASKAVPGMPHHLVLEDRRALTVSGVSDVDSFDELTVIIYTDLGELTLEGSIQSLSYADVHSRSGGFFGRLFK